MLARSWKSTLFGYSRLNFYGWIITSILINGCSLWAILRAINIGALRSPSSLMLLGIYFALIGLFNIAHQTYCARVSRHMKKQDAKEHKE